MQRQHNAMNNEKNTYNDSGNDIPAGMLSSPHIEYYLKKYEILKNYDMKYIGPASYHMRIGGEVLTWREGKQIDFILGKRENQNDNIRTKVRLVPNSLTFLTTIEEFQLPKDIIARFNLKSMWVHQGLLLGTGPIVDPQLHAKLLIPVHNFSSQTVTMYYGQEFISVEFTKTLDPDDEKDVGSEEKTKYKPNDHWDFDFHKYRQRISNRKVESSVQEQFEKNNQEILHANAILKKYTNINLWGGIALFIAICGLAFMTWSMMVPVRNKAESAYTTVKQFEASSTLENLSEFRLKISDLHEQIENLKKDIAKIDNEYKTMKSTAELNENRIRFEGQLKSMARRIEELENKLQ